MEAKVEITKHGEQIITCGDCTIVGDELFIYGNELDISPRLLDELYAVLHARHLAQHYDKTIMSRIGKAVNHE
jgi:hypothetical protein